MSDSEKLCLQWHEFQKIASCAFGDLKEDKDFTDVTLACEDGKQVEVHKVVIASSSPFFMDLLKRNKHPHPLIYMKGVKSEILMPMLEFFYFGEANVYQENLDTFLAFADELRLKGLNGSSDQSKHSSYKAPVFQSQGEKNVQDPSGFDKVGSFSKPFESRRIESKCVPNSFERTVALNSNDMGSVMQCLNEQIDSMMTTQENNRIGNRNVRVCKVCGKEGPMTTIRNHIEAKHVNGMSHTCDLCGKTAKTKNCLASHKSRNHRN